MNHIYKTANRYYEDFESYKGVITLTSLPFLLSILSIFFMVCAFAWYMDYISNPLFVRSKGERLLFGFLFEIIAIICWFRLQFLKEQKTKKSLRSRFNAPNASLTELKFIWFKNTFGIKNTDYIKIAKDLDNFLSLKESHSSSLSISYKEIKELIFSTDSKNRVLAMFMGICAVVAALCIAAGSNINIIFEQLESQGLATLFLYNVFISISILCWFLVMRYLTLLIYVATEFLTGKIDGINNRSKRKVRILINQLLTLHVIEKAKIKVSGTNQIVNYAPLE